MNAGAEGAVVEFVDDVGDRLANVEIEDESHELAGGIVLDAIGRGRGLCTREEALGRLERGGGILATGQVVGPGETFCEADSRPVDDRGEVDQRAVVEVDPRERGHARARIRKREAYLTGERAGDDFHPDLGFPDGAVTGVVQGDAVEPVVIRSSRRAEAQEKRNKDDRSRS